MPPHRGLFKATSLQVLSRGGGGGGNLAQHWMLEPVCLVPGSWLRGHVWEEGLGTQAEASSEHQGRDLPSSPKNACTPFYHPAPRAVH